MVDLRSLDNPVWHALTSEHATLALGDGLARRYRPDISPLSGLIEPTPAALADLHALASRGETVALLFDAPLSAPPAGWRVIKARYIDQMVWNGRVGEASTRTDRSAASNRITPARERLAPTRDPSALPNHPATSTAASGLGHAAPNSPPFVDEKHANFAILALGDADVAEMVELATLTEPGPFLSGAIRMGQYIGVRCDGRLAAMAGQRMRLPGLIEISAVCTHPDFRRRGYAAGLVMALIREAVSAGQRPFLHVKTENDAAKAAYARLGFDTRREVYFMVLERE